MMALLLLGMAIGIARRTVLAPLISLLIIGIWYIGSCEESVVRMGLLDGTVRLGCYVPETSECLDMLGLDSRGAPSRYEQGQDAAWYRERQAAQTKNVSRWTIAISSLPFGALMRALPAFGRTKELNDILKRQRMELQSQRSSLTQPLLPQQAAAIKAR